MRRIALFIVLAALIPSAALAKNMYVPISAAAEGANGTLFRTDLRIFNPSAQPISVTIHFLPANQDGSNVSGRLFEIPARGMAVFNNVVESVGFPRPSVGALRLDSDDAGTPGPDFAATSRTYTDSPNPAAPGSFGQFIPALEASAARTKIAVLQLSNSTDLSVGFRVNAGAMNPGLTASVVTPSLFRADGTLIKQGSPFTVLPRSVVQQSVLAMFGLDASNGNFADGYIAYRSTEPIFGYASVVDNRSSDQIFVLGQEDTGSLAPPPAPTPTEVMVNITPGFVFDPETVTIKRGDTVRWMFNGAAHTTTSDARNGPEVWDSGTRSSGSFAHTFQTAGQHPYYCRIHGGPGGSGMSGLVIVEP